MIIFLTYNQINNSNIWFAKVTIILIPIVQVLFSVFFSKKTRTLMPLSFCFRFTYTHYSKCFKVLFIHIYIYIYIYICIHIHIYTYIYTYTYTYTQISLTLRKIQVFSNFQHRNVSYPDYFCVLQQMFISYPLILIVILLFWENKLNFKIPSWQTASTWLVDTKRNPLTVTDKTLNENKIKK